MSLPISKNTKLETLEINYDVLILDSEPDILDELQYLIEEETNCTIDTASTIQEAVKKLLSTEYSVLVTEARIGAQSVLNMLKLLEDIKPDVKVVILTAGGLLEKDLENIKAQKNVVHFFNKSNIDIYQFLDRLNQLVF